MQAAVWYRRYLNLLRVGLLHHAICQWPRANWGQPEGLTDAAETFARRLTAFDIEDDGSLANRRLWADLGGGTPDGICLDREGAVWAADPRANECFRVLEGGLVTHRVATGDRGSFACVLGGDDRRMLLICTAKESGAGAAEARSGRIEVTPVNVPGAGLP